MKVLFVLPEYPPHEGGGLLAYYARLAPALAAAGHRIEVLVAAPFSPGFPARSRDGVSVESVPAAAVQRHAARFSRYSLLPDVRAFLGAAWAAWEQARGGEGRDVVEAADWGLLAAPWIARGGAPRVCVHGHGSAGQIDRFDRLAGRELQGEFLRLLEPALLARADAASATSRAEREFWERASGREGRLLLAPFPLPPEPATGHDGEAYGFVAARVQPWKGPATLCEALRILGKGAPEVRWAGRDVPCGALPSTGERLRERYPSIWGSRVVPLGPRSAREVEALQRGARVVIVPSDWDALNLSCVEALALGKVVVCSRGAGASDLVLHGENGFLFDAGDGAGLAGALGQALALGPRESEDMGRRARESVRRECDPGSAAAARVRAWEEALARKEARPPAPPDLAAALEGREGPEDPAAALETLPLRTVVGHAARRAARKVRRK